MEVFIGGCMKKGYKLKKWTEDRYLINFKYPKIKHNDCYECRGYYYIAWIPVRLIKIGEIEKKKYLSSME